MIIQEKAVGSETGFTPEEPRSQNIDNRVGGKTPDGDYEYRPEHPPGKALGLRRVLYSRLLMVFTVNRFAARIPPPCDRC